MDTQQFRRPVFGELLVAKLLDQSRNQSQFHCFFFFHCLQCLLLFFINRKLLLLFCLKPLMGRQEFVPCGQQRLRSNLYNWKYSTRKYAISSDKTSENNYEHEAPLSLRQFASSDCRFRRSVALEIVASIQRRRRPWRGVLAITSRAGNNIFLLLWACDWKKNCPSAMEHMCKKVICVECQGKYINSVQHHIYITPNSRGSYAQLQKCKLFHYKQKR